MSFWFWGPNKRGRRKLYSLSLSPFLFVVAILFLVWIILPILQYLRSLEIG